MSGAQKLIDKRIGEYKAKPLLPLDLRYIQKQLKDPDTSVEQFRPFYNQDPIFCASLLKLAWKATEDKDTHPYAADHSMSVVGIAGATQYFANLNQHFV